MRLPKLRDLTQAQKDVYLYAPTDKHVLVHGPPGTGKTLIACLRAIELQKKKVPVVLGMFNQVLARYSANATDGSELPSQTVLSWFRKWWNKSGVPAHPQAQKLFVNVPYEEKDRAKELGAYWNKAEYRPWGHKQGVWMVEPERYFRDSSAFSEWDVWHSPPTRSDKPDSLDWEAIAQHVLLHEEQLDLDSLSVGSLLIDEGQDFPPSFYKTIRNIAAIGAARKVAHPLRCLALADENQKITDENSTLEDIARELKIAESERYLLLDNFRNTKEVAELARRFFADVGVLPRLPKKSGPKPTFCVVAQKQEIAERIRIWLVNNPGNEIGAGVLVFNEASRSAIFDLLEKRCLNIKGRNITVQTYSWKSRQQHPAKQLLFDTPDVVTVLNMQSCKGLEFDGVFIVDISHAQVAQYGADRFKMQMFVAVSRSREWVSLLDSEKGAADAEYVQQLPGAEFLERDVSDSADAASVPRPIRTVPAAGAKSSSSADAGDSWETRLHQLVRSGKVTVTDNRLKGGLVWVEDRKGVEALVRPLGFQYSDKRSAWWRK